MPGTPASIVKMANRKARPCRLAGIESRDIWIYSNNKIRAGTRQKRRGLAGWAEPGETPVVVNVQRTCRGGSKTAASGPDLRSTEQFCDAGHARRAARGLPGQALVPQGLPRCRSAPFSIPIQTGQAD